MGSMLTNVKFEEIDLTTHFERLMLLSFENPRICNFLSVDVCRERDRVVKCLLNFCFS